MLFLTRLSYSFLKENSSQYKALLMSSYVAFCIEGDLCLELEDIFLMVAIAVFFVLSHMVITWFIKSEFSVKKT